MTTERIHAYCALCVSRCGAIATVQDGRLVKVEPDPDHPTGAAICGKARASPEMVSDPRRLTRPLIRTAPRGAEDPRFREASWDEALDVVAGRLSAAVEAGGPEALVVATASPSGSATSDAFGYMFRLAYAIGTPNFAVSTEICQWHRDFGAELTFGYGQPQPDIEHAGAILLWGHNPKTSWLARATKVVAARKRGAAVLVVDPRRAGAATQADLWLRVRPGADAALALGIAAELIRIGGHDETFVRRWTNAPALVHVDDGSTVAARDAGLDGEAPVAWNEARAAPCMLRPGEADGVALSAGVRVGGRPCRTVWDLLRDRLDEWPPERVESEAWVPADDVRRAAELLATRGPVSFVTWSGIAQSTNSSQAERAISTLYSLTGDLEREGGNVRFTGVPSRNPAGFELLDPGQAAKVLGADRHPLGPASKVMATSEAVRRAMIDGDPYRVRALLAFGTNWAVSQPDSKRTRRALGALDVHVQVDHTMTPTAMLADVVLPASMCWEREALRIGFEVDQRAASTIQLRPRVVDPPGEARGDLEIIFALADRLGLADRFFGGDIEAAWNAELEPSGLTVDDLRAAPGGRVELDLATVHRRYEKDGGFPTPSGRIELYSQRLRDAGYEPIPDHGERALAPQERGDQFGLVLTCAKSGHFCHSQHRAVPRLRAKHRMPTVELHPDAARARSIGAGDGVEVTTPHGAFRARAAIADTLHPRVVAGEFGWWQDCPDLDEPGFPPFDPAGANYNLAIGSDLCDPISGSAPLRGYACEVRRVGVGAGRG